MGSCWKNVNFFFQARPSKPAVTTGAESDRSKQMDEKRKKVSHLKNVDSKLANHIIDEILERYKNFILVLLFMGDI